MNPHLEAYLKTIGVPKDQAEAALKNWTVAVVKRDHKEIGIVITSGTEIHFVLLGGPAMTRKNTLEFLKPIYDEFGFVTTRTPIAETDDRLRDVLGFKYQWHDESFKYWSLTELPWQKKVTPKPEHSKATP